MSDPDKLVNHLFCGRLQSEARRVGFSLDAEQADSFRSYFEILLRWDRKMNLTGLPLEGLPDRALNRLFIEPLQAAQVIEDVSLRWFDIGSGGGSPAIPLKIVRPRLRLSLLEPRSKKAAFLREVVRSLELTETDVLEVRIEDVRGYRAQVDLLTVRALRTDETFWQAAATLLRIGGRLLMFGSKPLRRLRQDASFHLAEQIKLTDGTSLLYVLRRVEIH